MRDDLPYKYPMYTVEELLDFLKIYKEGWE